MAVLHLAVLLPRLTYGASITELSSITMEQSSIAPNPEDRSNARGDGRAYHGIPTICSSNTTFKNGKCNYRLNKPAEADVYDSRHPKAIFVSFDDGPGAGTQAVLDALERAGQVKATFYLTAINFARWYNSYAAVLQSVESLHRIINEGHMVGAHSFDHMQDCFYAPSKAAAEWDYYNFVQGIERVVDEIKCSPGSSCMVLGAKSRVVDPYNQYVAVQDMRKYARMPCTNLWRTPTYNRSDRFTSKNSFVGDVGDQLYANGHLVHGWDSAADWKYNNDLPWKMFPATMYGTALIPEDAEMLNKKAAAYAGSTANDTSTAPTASSHPCLQQIDNVTAQQKSADMQLCEMNRLRSASWISTEVKALLDKQMEEMWASNAINFNKYEPCYMDPLVLQSGDPCSAEESICLQADYIDAIHYNMPRRGRRTRNYTSRSGDACALKYAPVVRNETVLMFTADGDGDGEGGGSGDGRRLGDGTAHGEGVWRALGPSTNGKVAFLTHDRYFADAAQEDMLVDLLVELRDRGYSFELMRDFTPGTSDYRPNRPTPIAMVVALTTVIWGFVAIGSWIALRVVYKNNPWLKGYGFWVIDRILACSCNGRLGGVKGVVAPKKKKKKEAAKGLQIHFSHGGFDNDGTDDETERDALHERVRTLTSSGQGVAPRRQPPKPHQKEDKNEYTCVDVESAFRESQKLYELSATLALEKAARGFLKGATVCDSLAMDGGRSGMAGAAATSHVGTEEQRRLSSSFRVQYGGSDTDPYFAAKAANMRERAAFIETQLELRDASGLSADLLYQALPPYQLSMLPPGGDCENSHNGHTIGKGFRYTAVNSIDPKAMAREGEVRLRAGDRTDPAGAVSRTSMGMGEKGRDLTMIVITMYNEEATELEETLLKVARNIYYHTKADKQKAPAERYFRPEATFEDFVVCIVSDGRTKANAGTLRALESVRLFDAKAMSLALLGDDGVTMHLFENDIALVKTGVVNQNQATNEPGQSGDDFGADFENSWTGDKRAGKHGGGGGESSDDGTQDEPREVPPMPCIFALKVCAMPSCIPAT
jgi:hypothetical protein